MESKQVNGQVVVSVLYETPVGGVSIEKRVLAYRCGHMDLS